MSSSPGRVGRVPSWVPLPLPSAKNGIPCVPRGRGRIPPHPRLRFPLGDGGADPPSLRVLLSRTHRPCCREQQTEDSSGFGMQNSCSKAELASGWCPASRSVPCPPLTGRQGASHTCGWGTPRKRLRSQALSWDMPAPSHPSAQSGLLRWPGMGSPPDSAPPPRLPWP